MPTTGKLAGAVFFALLAGLLAYLLVPFFENGRAPRYWYPLCGIAGIMTGWMVVGPRTGNGTGQAIGVGLTGAAATAFWVLILLSGYDMIQASMRGRYDGPMDAVIAVFTIMTDYAQQLYAPFILAVWLGGGIVAGLLTDALGKRYR
ncbi:TrgA family protein [Loktanella sp. DJP18]|uniref:TrgA family protein n=1 Tax=Loktanella sp. DJP18 TaxID=3409788 RepID=UPI003BB53D49